MHHEPQTMLETTIYNPPNRRSSSVPLQLVDDDDNPMENHAVKTCIDYAINRSPTPAHPTSSVVGYDDPLAVHATVKFPPKPGVELGVHPATSIQVEVVYPIARNAVVKLLLSLPIIVYGESPDHSIITYQANLVVTMREADLSNLIYIAFQPSVSEYRFNSDDSLKEAREELNHKADLLAKAIRGEPEVAFLQALTDHVNTFQTSIPWPNHRPKVTALNGSVAITVNPES